MMLYDEMNVASLDEECERKAKKIKNDDMKLVIRLIHVEKILELESFPRYPDNMDLITYLSDIDRENTFIVFISHCWLRGHVNVEGYDGRPHPDNPAHDKFKLIKKGVLKLWKQLAPRMEKCAVWIDYGCINQNAQPAAELKILDVLIGACDCIFTPIYDENRVLEMPSFNCNWYEDFKSTLWSEGPYAYLNRGWCRLEMFYAANISMINSMDRLSKFEAGLKEHMQCQRRAHFLISNHFERRSHIILPPLQNSYFERFHPEKGVLSVETDKEKIQLLVNDLLPYMTFAENAYEGMRFHGKRVGHGIMRYCNGDVYEGDFLNDFCHGEGRLCTFDGDVYSGSFIEGKKCGYGVLKRANGNVYKGMWMNDRRHGKGQFTWITGQTFEGEYVNGKRHCLTGVMVFPNGDRYSGVYRNDLRDGGVFVYGADGSTYQGEWLKNARHGYGKLTSASGEVLFEGMWSDDKQVPQNELSTI